MFFFETRCIYNSITYPARISGGRPGEVYTTGRIELRRDDNNRIHWSIMSGISVWCAVDELADTRGGRGGGGEAAINLFNH